METAFPSDDRKPRVGLVGVGRMGANMARRLAEQGFAVTAVYDARHESAMDLAGELKSTAAATLAEVTARANIILTIVTDDDAMRAIFTAPEDNLLVGAAGRLFINCATVSPAVHRELEPLIRQAGASAIEACLASSIAQAREGTLFLILAGEAAAVKRAEPVLAAIGSARHFVGATGRAAEVKALVNMVMNINTAGLAEGLGLGAALGLDLTQLREIFARTGAASRVLETDGLDMQHREHDCFFSAEHAAKDSGIALSLRPENYAPLPLAAAALEQYEKMVRLGLGDFDKSGVAELTFPGRAPIEAT